MKDLTVSLCQADLYWEAIEANLSMFEEMIWQIDAPTDMIILPEMFTTGFTMNAKGLSEPHGGKTFQWMKMMATQRQAAVVGSYIVKDQGQFYNRFYFVYPNGTARYYNKRHLFALAGEHEVYASGAEKRVLDYRGWKICPQICYDLRFPVWARSQKAGDHLYEYDLLIYTANWPEPRTLAWDTLLPARAIENQAYCAGVNRVGVDGFHKNYLGHTAMYSFKGEKLSEAKDAQTVTVQLSAEALATYRSRYPFQADSDSFEVR